MASFSNASFSTGAFSVGAFDFGDIGGTSGQDGARRRHVRRKLIEHEQKILKEYLDSLAVTATPSQRVRARKAVATLLRDGDFAGGVVDEAKAAVAEAEEEFKKKYWARFLAITLHFFN